MHLFWKVCYNAVLLEALSYLQPYFQLILFVFLFSTSYCCVNSDYFFATLVFSLFISHEFLRISYKILFLSHSPPTPPSISSILTSLPPQPFVLFLVPCVNNVIDSKFCCLYNILLGVDHPMQHVLPTRSQLLPLEAITCQ